MAKQTNRAQVGPFVLIKKNQKNGYFSNVIELLHINHSSNLVLTLRILFRNPIIILLYTFTTEYYKQGTAWLN